MPQMFEEDDKSEPGDPEWRDNRPNLNFWENEEGSDTFTEPEHQHIPAVSSGSSFSFEDVMWILFWLGLFAISVIILFLVFIGPH